VTPARSHCQSLCEPFSGLANPDGALAAGGVAAASVRCAASMARSASRNVYRARFEEEP